MASHALDALGDPELAGARGDERGATAPEDPAARADLVARYMPFARALAAKAYARRKTEEIAFDEYEQLAMVGLVESVNRYEPGRGAKFTTYALPRIQGSILNGLARLTERQQQLAFRRRVAAERLESLAPDALELDPAQRLLAQLEEIGVGVALGFLLEGTGMVRDASELLPDDAYAHVELRQQHARLWDMTKLLTDREREVIDLHYKQARRFDEIADELRLTKGRVSQLHKQAIQRLRALVTKSEACDVAF
jgi:RNA polymerase sigma factor for flagellar operon FliA